MATLTLANAAPILNTGSPVGFFTNVASRLLSSELNLNLTGIQVYPTNQYTPAVHRLLQVTANVYDATTTNFYPSVFRPVFSRDAGGLGTNVFISGYTNVTGVSGLNDGQLAQPIDTSALAAMSGVVTNLAVNVYGVPWIIGAKKGFPNFNEFTMQNVVEVTRKLQVTRQTITGPISTNQMYIFSVSNSLGAELWNSYSSNYVGSGSIQGLVRDNISMALTNDVAGFSPPQFINAGFTNAFLVSVWPGSVPWNPDPYTGQPQSYAFFIPLDPTISTVVLLTNSVYYYGPGSYVPPGGGAFSAPCFIPQYLVSSNFLDSGISQLPHFGLLTTNRLQVVILDGSNVIDYVHFAGPNSSRDLNAELQDPFSTGNPAYMWSTNSYLNGLVPMGVVNQLICSRGLITIPANDGGLWDNTYGALEQPFFDAFFYKGNPKQLSPPINGQTSIINTNMSQQAPFSPIRIIYEYISWQANDPLVHYLASDLNYSGRDTTPPTGTNQWNSPMSPLPRPVFGVLNNNYQPWGKIHLIYPGLDTNPYNLAYKDPLVWQSDDWSFPTNEPLAGSWLGQVHRGTPWQTIYLKASDVLGEIQNGVYIGTNTWMNWTGDLDANDAAAMAPVQDRHLASLLASLFNTNDLRSLSSVNNTAPNAWLVLLNGLTAWTNTLPDQFDAVVISSNSPQASVIANAIQSVRINQSGQFFRDVGDILATPQLTEQSPFLNWNDSVQQQDGISDVAYEMIPSQLLSLLRTDSIGSVASLNGQILVQFTGYDGHAYAVQVSSDLMNWTTVSTNSPANGAFSFTITAPANAGSQFYRSVLLQ